MNLDIENNERLFLLKLVNKEIQRAFILKGTTTGKWDTMYSIKDKLLNCYKKSEAKSVD